MTTFLRLLTPSQVPQPTFQILDRVQPDFEKQVGLLTPNQHPTKILHWSPKCSSAHACFMCITRQRGIGNIGGERWGYLLRGRNWSENDENNYIDDDDNEYDVDDNERLRLFVLLNNWKKERNFLPPFQTQWGLVAGIEIEKNSSKKWALLYPTI